MNYRAIAFFLVIAAALTVLIVSCSDPGATVLEAATIEEYRQDVKEAEIAVNQLPSNTKALVTELSEHEGDLTEEDSKEFRSDVMAEGIAALAVLDEQIKSLEPDGSDSEEYAEWKQDYQNCLKTFRSSISEGDELAEDRITSNPEVFKTKPCEAEAARNLSNADDQSKADKQTKDTQTALGVLLVVVGLVLLAFGIPEGATVLALGLAMIGQAQGGGDESQSSNGTSNQESEQSTSDRNLPQDLVEQGFSSYGGAGGDVSFLYSNTSKEWRLVNFGTSETTVLAESTVSNTSNFSEVVGDGAGLYACKLSDHGSEGLIMSGNPPCPNFALNRNESKWVTSRTTPAGVVTE